MASTIVFGAEENVPFTLSIGPQFQKICENQIAVPYKLTNIAEEPLYIAQFPGISLAVNCQEKSGSMRFSIPGGIYSEDGDLPRDYFVELHPGEGLRGIGVVTVPEDCSKNISIQGVYQSTGGGLHLGLHAWKGDVRSASLPFSWSGEVTLKFEAATPSDAPAAKEYEAIWAADGVRIVQALEARSGLSFEEFEIDVVVVEAPSHSGFKKIPMNLRSSYPLDTKKATLVHELGHRLQGRLFTKDDEDHPFLFLYLYDVWVSLFGKEFADQQVKVESERRGYYDYESAWRTILAMTAEQRFAKWKEFLKSIVSNKNRYVDPTEQLVTEILVRDISRSVKFYRQLGFTFLRDGGDFVELTWEDHRLFLAELSAFHDADEPAMPSARQFPTANIRIMVPNVDEYWKLSNEIGARVVLPIDDRYYGLRDFIIADPDGFGVRFASNLSGKE